MEERIETVICERCDDLISFLYHELGKREARDFEQHLSACASCSSQLASFKEIRDDVVAWRDQTLGLTLLTANVGLSSRQAEKPSALAAIRQFLDLSPLWLKGAVAFASILFFAVTALLLVNLNRKPDAPIAGNDKLYSEAEMRAKVDAAIQDRLKEFNSPGDVEETPGSQVVVKNNKPKAKPAGLMAKTRRAPLTRSERQQLAADLWLITPADDSDLNLLGEQINR